MKTLTSLFTLAASLLIGTAVTAQNGFQLIKITVTSNSNMPGQQPATTVLMFDASGNDSLAFPDAGNEGTLGQIGSQVFPFSVTSDSTVVTNFDSRTALTGYRTIPVGFVSKLTADIKVIATVASSDSATPAPAFVWLEQISTGERHSLLDTAKFTIAANPNFASDFILHTGPMCGSVSTDETCYNYENGTIATHSPNYSNFTLELTQGTTQILNTVVAGTDTTISNLAAGNYVSVIRINGIPVDSSDIIINGATPLIADFLTDYNFVNPGALVNFTDNSTGGLDYTWDFGDGDSTFSTSGDQSHTFVNVGSYQVTLLIADSNGCQSTTYDFVTVDTASQSLANNHFSGPNSQFNGNGHSGYTATPVFSADDNTYYSNERIVVETETAVAKVSVVAVNGAVIYTGAQNDTRAEYAVPAAGVYIVTIEHTNGTVTSHSVLAQ